MSILLATLLYLVDPPATKPLPNVPEPNWTAWAALREARGDRKYQDEAELDEARKRVAAAHATLEARPDAGWAAGAMLVQTTADDWERLMAASVLAMLGKEKGEPFVVWAWRSRGRSTLPLRPATPQPATWPTAAGLPTCPLSS